jgi:serine/threonine protein phosphatase PrpC
MRLTIQVEGKSDVGTVRPNNEDNFGFDTASGIFVVCDGMGGAAAGERASKIAVDCVLDYFQHRPNSEPQLLGRTFESVSARANNLAQAIQLANLLILQEAAQNPEFKGMGSTIVAIAVENNEFSVAHVGDSRAYILREGSLQRLTTDHSLVMEQVRRGLLAREEAAHAADQNVILRSLGADDSVDPDLADHFCNADDLLLLCSDGLSHFVKDEVMAPILIDAATLADACEKLIATAKSSGSNDNITCLLVRFEEISWGGRLLEKLTPPKRQNSI